MNEFQNPPQHGLKAIFHSESFNKLLLFGTIQGYLLYLKRKGHKYQGLIIQSDPEPGTYQANKQKLIEIIINNISLPVHPASPSGTI